MKHLVVLNNDARMSNSRAQDAYSILVPLQIVKFDENQQFCFDAPVEFPQCISDLIMLKSDLHSLWELMKFYNLRVLRPTSFSDGEGDSQAIGRDYMVMDLGVFQEVRGYPEVCLKAFVAHIGVKMKVIKALTAT
ncbi:hypothetical protein TWF718_002323 [Orbilia javanica]|uniref:Uncharacterized protein n=1 Tax=Orbilia javanica TaxID=47235 RepID=A0AAN8NM20_9PEZI